MGKKSGDYFGLGKLVSLLLTIIGVGWIMGVIQRILDGHIVAGLLRLIFGIYWISIVDIVLILLNGKMLRVLKV